jgi:hypothetical protein
MNDILELLPIPSERDFPAGRQEARRDALVSHLRAEQVSEPATHRVIRAARGHITKSWLSLLGIVALLVALASIGLSAQQRLPEKGAVAVVAVAGTAQLVASVVPRGGWAAAFAPADGRRLNRLHLMGVGTT